MLDYGTGGGMAAGFEIDGIAAQILTTGEYGSVQIVDTARADALRNDPSGRFKNAIAYLDANIKRFDLLDSKAMHPHSWRNSVGAIDPVDTMSRELLPDLRKSYVMVREAIERFEKSLNNEQTEDVT